MVNHALNKQAGQSWTRQVRLGSKGSTRSKGSARAAESTTSKASSAYDRWTRHSLPPPPLTRHARCESKRRARDPA
eukprot:2546104-Pleurochrysis_carterae.AAC.3